MVVENIIKEIHKEVVGEYDIIFLLTHVFASRYILNKNPQSFHTLINSNSGAGKDYVLTKFINIFDKNICENYTRISARALDYLHTEKESVMQGFTWDNKYLCLHDIEEGVLNSSTLKLFLSEGTKTAIVQDGKVRVRQVKGRPVVIMTSAYSDPEREQLRRMNLINLDESDEQTKRIMKFDGKKKINYKKLRKIFDSLKERNVTVPYRNEMAELMCHNDIFMRSFFPKIIDFIKSSAILNQKERDSDPYGYVVANYDDYLNAKKIIQSMSYGLSFKPISLSKKEIIEKIIENYGYENNFSIKDIEGLIGCSYENARKHIKKLQQDGILLGIVQKNEYTNKPYVEYCLKSNEKIELPPLKQLIQLKQPTTRTPPSM